MSRPARILVVDDDPGLRRALLRILQPAYRVEAVAGAGEALARVPSLAQGAAAADHPPFDLALVDVRLQDGDGYSLCKALRERRPQMDVILITGSISEPDEKLFRALEEGAFYFLFKPFERRVLLALVERCLSLQRERAAKERYASVLAADLERARLFQQSLVPRRPVAAAGWRVEGRLLTCDALGGDFYLAQPDELGLVVAVCDVVGHGVSAAMYAGMLRSTLGAACRQGADPEPVARQLLGAIDFLSGPTCATMVYALLRPDGRVRAFSAGHPPLLLLRANGGVEHLASTGPLLNRIFSDRPLPAREVAAGPGDRLLAYSDGAFEARSPADQELGLERLERAFADLAGRPAGEALDALLDLVRAHGAGRPVADDVTLLLAERTG
ncbi:MAG TPA: SpoIIE family protein phosphatase [Thermoanaerobaculia bacterium]